LSNGKVSFSTATGFNHSHPPTMLRNLRVTSSIAVMALLFVAPAHAQTSADTAGIRAAALDYIEGWYEGNAERMERAVHPDLAKRIVNTDSRSGRSALGHQSAMTLVLNTRRGGGKETPVVEQRKDVRILDIFENVASVRVDASTWIDYLQLAKWNGRWVIVNVLWENRPRER
jgi:hypothetical protein